MFYKDNHLDLDPGVVFYKDNHLDPDPGVIFFMYRRPILCTLYGAVDFLNVLKKQIMYL
jgi:hypothetical protein